MSLRRIYVHLDVARRAEDVAEPGTALLKQLRRSYLLALDAAPKQWPPIPANAFCLLIHTRNLNGRRLSCDGWCKRASAEETTLF